ncbi:MAG: transcriptional repressor [Oscillospiraceae bacterium]|nr:MAG: transcriptional repressor [Oscillospiraceae bacterium]
MTKYEKSIHDLISGSSSHLTAEQVYQALKAEYPQVVLATVYNNLNKLCDAGLIRRVSVEGSPDRYDRIVKHDHIVCRRCGKLIDVQFEDLTESLKEQLGEDFFFYDLKVFSLCPDCKKELENRQ